MSRTCSRSFWRSGHSSYRPGRSGSSLRRTVGMTFTTDISMLGSIYILPIVKGESSREHWPQDGPGRDLLVYLSELRRRAGRPAHTAMARAINLAPTTVAPY